MAHAFPGKHRVLLRLGVPLLAGLVIGAMLLFRLGGVLDREPSPLAHEVVESDRSGARGESLLQEPRSPSTMQARQSRAAFADPCAYFDPWKGLECSFEHVTVLLASARPLESLELACLPPDWLLTALLAHCRGGLLLGAEELATVGAEAARRLPPGNALAASSFGKALRAEELVCLVEALLGEGKTEAEAARIWGALLAAAYGEKGSVFGPNAEVLQALRPLMENWPIHSEAWWESLWGSLAGEPQSKFGLPVRLALVELLHERLSEAEWLERVDRLAALGPSREKLDGLTVVGMGMCLARLLPEERFVGLLGEPLSDSLRRGVLLQVPPRFHWPEAGHAELSPEVRAGLLRLQDDADFPHRLDLVQRQWQLFGPELAAEDLAAFAFEGGPKAADWHFEAGLRIHQALGAIRAYGSRSDADAPSIALARDVLRQWVLTMPAEDLRRVAERLHVSFWNSSGDSVVTARRLLTEVVGSAELAALPPEVRTLLVGE